MNKHEIAKFLAETHRRLHDQRRRYEWQVLLSVLTLMVGAVAVVLTKEAALPAVSMCWKFSIPAILFASLTLIAAIFLRYLHRANWVNKAYAESLEDMLKNDPFGEFPAFPNKKLARLDWAYGCQLVVILWAMLVAWLIVGSVWTWQSPTTAPVLPSTSPAVTK